MVLLIAEKGCGVNHVVLGIETEIIGKINDFIFA
jgi:hypothetical protein